MYRGNVTVSSDGKLRAESVKEMADASLLSNGLYISMGSLTVADSAKVEVTGAYGADISGGSIQLRGGTLTAASTQMPDTYGNPGNAISVDVGSGTANTGNITVNGGTLKTVNGKIDMFTTRANDNQGLFTVTGGTVVNSGRLYGPKKLDISGGTVQTQGIDSTAALTLSGGTLTVREPVRKNPYSGELWASPAVDVSNLAVSGGTLDAAWDWGEFAPMVLPKDEGYNDVGILVRMPYDFNAATFTGGTTILDTGYAGNTALMLKGQLTTGTDVAETSADTSSAGVHKQEYSDTPVVFSNVNRTKVTASNVAAQDKTYDGTTAATLTAGSLTGVQTGDTVSLGSANVTANFKDANVGTDKSVTVTDGTFDLRGKDAYKYELETQPTDLTGLSAKITACKTFTDATTKTQTTYVGSGSFEKPKFTGVTVNGKAEEVTGNVTYQVKNENKTVEQIGEALKALKAGETLEISYTFTPTKGGNYSGTKPGTITVTAKDRPSSGGGSSRYAVDVAEAEHGAVTASCRSAARGDTVTVTVTPDSGYVLEALTATDRNGKELALTDKGDGRYTFTMPSGKVEVKATFMEDNSVLNFFYDVPNDAYYYEAVKWAVGEGITTGVGNDLFAPDGACTRAQAVTFLWRAAGSPAPESTAMPFTDVPAGSYYHSAVLWAIENGITVGTSADAFSPDADCTRAQIVTFLWRAEGAPAAGSSDPFTDVAADAYYADAVLWAVKEGITNGATATTFSPDVTCTRAQIVTFLYRCMK